MPVAAVRSRHVPDGAELASVGREAGLDAVGITGAQPFATTRAHLERRRTAGLSDSMAFTYRRPERSTDPGRALRDARSLVVGARSYRREVGPTVGAAVPAGCPAGRVARYAWQDHYAALREALGTVAARLQADGWRARVLADDNALVDREAAYRAGIGWYGKNANLMIPGEGSWFVLGSVVTDAPLTPTGDRVADGCGGCARCMESCPTGAIVSPGVVDARRCLAWLLQVEGPFPREHRVALGDRLYGCDDCQTSCPVNLRAERSGPAPPAVAADAQVVVDIVDLLGRSDGDLMDRHGRWYVPRRQARYLRRNALVVLGNTAFPGSTAAIGALRRVLGHDDPLVRGHAVWAARRLGRDDLLAAVAADRDPFVREELQAPVPPRSPVGAHPASRRVVRPAACPVDVPNRQRPGRWIR